MKCRPLICAAAAAVACALSVPPVFAADSARATVSVDGTTFTYSGGSCVKSGSLLAVNFGTPGSADGKASSDYFGVSIDKAPGHFDNTIVSFVKNGRRYSILEASGEATESGATFSGKLTLGGTAKGSFTC